MKATVTALIALSALLVLMGLLSNYDDDRTSAGVTMDAIADAKLRQHDRMQERQAEAFEAARLAGDVK
jgi:predicted hotdog family 3-hydroxylacyl-ACP dehydratase